MPLPKRVVEPVHVARGTIPEELQLPSELEAVTNGTLANTIRQLSSLSRHAEDLFGELTREAHLLASRAGSLQARIDRLADKVTRLDSNVEEVSLQDIHMRKAFRSAVIFDQQVVSRNTMPSAMLETYQMCDKPPPLDKLNQYREDGKDGLKFYTDPNYFFELWRQEMLKDTERMIHDKGKKPHRPRTEAGGRHKKRVRQPHNTRERQQQAAVGHGEFIMSHISHYRAPHTLQQHPDEMYLSITNSGSAGDSRPPRPNSIELRRNYPEDSGSTLPPNTLPYPPGMALYSLRSPCSPTESHARTNYSMAIYDEGMYQVHAAYAGGQENVVDGYAGTNTQTPNRSGSLTSTSRQSSQRPTQPPPAPPSTTSSHSTPTVSSASNTPTRGRSASAGRETLPPPPPPPMEPVVPHLLNRSRSGSRSASPLSASNRSTPTPPSVGPPPASHTPEQRSSLPPPPPSPEFQRQSAPSPPPQAQQAPQRVASPCSAPPPPPPPPPPPGTIPNGPLAQTGPFHESHTHTAIPNGDLNKSPSKQIISTSPPKTGDSLNRSKNTSGGMSAPVYDPRSNLLKAIRDGIKLRKVEKIEQKEVERVNALHDVASILARRVAVEFSDSDSASESEYDSEGWGEPETSA